MDDRILHVIFFSTSSAVSYNLSFMPSENSKLKWIDIHTHLDGLEQSPADALALAQGAGVERLVTIGTEEKDLPVVLGLSQQFAPHVFCTLGIHPHYGKTWSESTRQFLRTHLSNPRVIAVGEIGLDYFYKNSESTDQKETFRHQMQIAQEFGLPVEIHTRDAEADTFEILNEFKSKVFGVIHCFTSSADLAKKCLDLGYDISFSGIVTFKNANDLRQVCQDLVPLDRLHIETDSPFLSPVPVRGKKNTPAHIVHTAQFVADLKKITLAQLSEQTRKNADRLFPKLTA